MQSHEKAVTVHGDQLNQIKTLRLNFIKWFNECNTINMKLQLRDQLKNKYDRSVLELQQLGNKKDMARGESVVANLDLQIRQVQKEVKFFK